MWTDDNLGTWLRNLGLFIRAPYLNPNTLWLLGQGFLVRFLHLELMV